MELFNIGIDLISMLIPFIIFLSLMSFKKSETNPLFPVLLVLHTLTIVCDIAINTFQKESVRLVYIQVAFGFVAFFILNEMAAINVYFDNVIAQFLLKNRAVRIVPFVIGSILLTIWVNSFWHGYMFTMDKKGYITHEKYIWLILIFYLLIVAFNLFRVIKYQRQGMITGKICLGMYIYLLLPPISLLGVHYIGSISLFYANLSVSYLIMYISIHVRAQNDEMVKEVVDTQLQTDLIIARLQPHFMFNTLTVIKYLCETNNVLASEATGNFSKFLRFNLDSIKHSEYISFAEEMEHVRNYVWLERLRFKDYIRVNYSVDTEHFKIPPLTVQPIVENAIFHGITRKMGGGTLNISVRENPNCYKIVVEDTGLGFDTEVLKDSSRGNMSIAAIAKRLDEMNGSTIDVKSQRDLGTTVTITINKEGQSELWKEQQK